MGLVLMRSGAVRMDTCCCRPPAMLPLLVGAIEYSVSGCSCVISFLFRCPCTSTLCWLYKICKVWKKRKKIHSTVKSPIYTVYTNIYNIYIYIQLSSQLYAGREVVSETPITQTGAVTYFYTSTPVTLFNYESEN